MVAPRAVGHTLHDMTPRSVLPDEYEPALRLLFRHLAAAELDYRVDRALAMIPSGLDVGGLFVLPGADGPLGVMLCQSVAGGGGLVWPPVVAVPDPAREDALVARACDWLRRQGSLLAQCLLPDEEFHFATPLLRNGFTHLTGLSYLRHELALTAAWLTGEDRLAFSTYDARHPLAFHATLQASYEGTLDCPEVNGVRTIEQVIAGHQSQGRHDPSTWWLAWLDGKPVGVLMLVEAEPREWEVAYVGVVPSARRRGVALGLMHQALCHARLVDAVRLMLSVDDRNTPARRLYQRLGFEPYDHREVVMVRL